MVCRWCDCAALLLHLRALLPNRNDQSRASASAILRINVARDIVDDEIPHAPNAVECHDDAADDDSGYENGENVFHCFLSITANDLFGFGNVEMRFGIVNRNRASRGLDEAVSDHSRGFYHNRGGLSSLDTSDCG